MAKLTILRGISGSGKSTWARMQDAVVVSRDDLRDMYAPVHRDNPAAYYALHKDVLAAHEQTITVMQDALVGGLLRAGKDVIVDNTSIEWKHVKALAKIGYRYGAEVEVKVFDVPLGEAMRRDEFRGRSGGRWVGNEVIKKQHERFKHNKNKTLEPVFAPEPYEGTPGKPDAFMFDLDGTVFHMNGKRGPYDLNVDVDDPDPIVFDIVARLIDSGLTAIAMSGRKEAARKATEKALYDWVGPRHLFMRADDDNRADNLVKADLFDEHVRDNYNVLFVLDDRDQVVDMWRRMGLTCLQVADGDF